MLLLDTNALLWMTEADPRLGAKTRLSLESAAADELSVSAFSFWEIAILIAKRRLGLRISPADYRAQVLSSGIAEIVVDGAIGVTAVMLGAPNNDPADRIIAATALAHDATLITADDRLLNWHGALKTHDARL